MAVQTNVSILVTLKDMARGAIDALRAKLRDLGTQGASDISHVDKATRELAQEFDRAAGAGESAAAGARDAAVAVKLEGEAAKWTRDANGRLRDEMGRFVTAARAAAAGLREEGAEATKTAGHLSFLERAHVRARLEMARMKGVAGEVFSSVRGWMSSMQGVAAQLGISIAGGIAVTKLVEYNREYQRLTAQLRTFTGSADAAKAKFEELQDAAIRLPFELKNITQAYINLRGAGIDPTMAMMDALSNVAVAAQKDIADLGEAIRGAVTGEYERLKQFNVIARDAGDKLAVTFNGVTTKIEKSATAVTAYLYKLGNTEFAGASIRQMETLDGKISNLQDNLFKLATAIGKAGVNEFVGEQVDSLNDLTTALLANATQLEKWTRGIIAGIRAVVFTITKPIAAIWYFGEQVAAALSLLFGNLFSAILKISGHTIQILAMVADAVPFLKNNVGAYLHGLEKDAYDALQKVQAKNDEMTDVITGNAEKVVGAIADQGQAYRDLYGIINDTDKAERKRGATGKTQREKEIDQLATVVRLHKKGSAERVEAEKQLQRVLNETTEAINRGLTNGASPWSEGIKRLQQQQRSAIEALGYQDQKPTGGKESKDPLGDRIELLGKAVAYDNTRQRALKELATIEETINKKLKDRHLTLAQEVDLREKLANVAKARDLSEQRSKEITYLLEAAKIRQDHSEAIDKLTRRERTLSEAVRDSARYSERRIAVESELARLREERTEGLVGEATYTEELSAREEELSRELQFLNAVERESAKNTKELADVREKLRLVTKAFTGEDYERLIELEAADAAELEKLRSKMHHTNEELARMIALEKELAAIREVKHETTGSDPVTGAPLPLPKVQDPIPTTPAEDTKGAQVHLPGIPIPKQPDERDINMDGQVTQAERLAKALEKVNERLNGTHEHLGNLKDILSDVVSVGFEALGNASVAAFEKIIHGSKGAGAAFRDAMKAAIADYAKRKGMVALGDAAHAFGQGLLGDPKGFVAGAKFLAAAAIYFAIAGAASGGGGSGAGGGGGSSASGTIAGEKEERGKVYVQFPKGANVFDWSNPEIEEQWIRTLENLSDRDVIVQRGSQ